MPTVKRKYEILVNGFFTPFYYTENRMYNEINYSNEPVKSDIVLYIYNIIINLL